MCGIAGIYNLKVQQQVRENELKQMCDRMVHRGPDEGRYYLNGAVGLGHRRLSIIDLEGGKQPMSNANGTTWITFNGEIYNFKALRQQLTSKGYPFKTKSDTETIIYAYDEWGEDCVQHIDGMFAFAIWDDQKRKLFAARDRFGKKPFFYSWDGQRFIFASEIQALLASENFNQEVDPQALYDYFHLGFILAPKTIYRSVRKLPQGHYLVLGSDGLRIQKYWDLSEAKGNRSDLSDAKALEQFENHFHQCVRSRLVSDVPLGAFLSGGIDSTTVVQSMADLNVNQLMTCSIRFKDKRSDESDFAFQTATRLYTNHFVEVVDEDLSSLEVLKKLIYLCGEPLGDSSMIPTYFVSKMARRHVTVALSGDGGDETLGGYPRYQIDALENRLAYLVPLPLKWISNYMLQRSNPFNRGICFHMAFKPWEAYFWGFSALKPFAQNRFNPEFLKMIKGYHPKDHYRSLFERVKNRDYFSAMQYVDINTYMVDDILTKVDRMSMANSLEVRSPFLDHKMVEWLFLLPLQFRVRGGRNKWLSKAWLQKKGYSHKYIRRPKQGFSIPEAQWLKTIYRNCMEDILDQKEVSEIFYISRLKQDWNQFLHSDSNESSFWWNILIFGLWNQHRKGWV